MIGSGNPVADLFGYARPFVPQQPQPPLAQSPGLLSRLWQGIGGGTAQAQPRWEDQPHTEAEIARRDLAEHGNQPLGVTRLEGSDPNADPRMNRLRPGIDQWTGDTFMSVNPEEGEMQGDPGLRENIQFKQPAPAGRGDLLSQVQGHGLLERGNIDLNARPVVRNPDGSYSTVRSMNFNEDGKEILIPTVAADGSRLLSPQEAIDQYHQTGQHLGIFQTPEAAEAYAQLLHQSQEQQYNPRAMGLFGQGDPGAQRLQQLYGF